MTLELDFVELRIVERTNVWRQTTERTNQPELSDENVGDQAKLDFVHEIKLHFRLMLHLSQRIAAAKKVGDQCAGAEAAIRDVASLIGEIERSPQQRPASAHVSCPRDHVIRKRHQDAGLEPIQTSVVDEVEAELAKVESCLVLAEVRPKHHTEIRVAEGRRVAVTMLDAQIRHAAQNEAHQVLV